MKTIIMSKDNEKDLADVPEEVREDLTIHTVETIDEVLNLALENVKAAEVLPVETPQIWTSDTTSSDISATIK